MPLLTTSRSANHHPYHEAASVAINGGGFFVVVTVLEYQIVPALPFPVHGIASRNPKKSGIFCGAFRAFKLKWNPQKANTTLPTTFTQTYPVTDSVVITPDNYLQYL
jgi:hypothetical protein